MIFIYAFVAFLFFKIFPEFAEYRSNTVVGALMMASASALVLQVAEWAGHWRVGLWVQTPPRLENDAPQGLWIVAVCGVAASVGATYLVGVGFADTFMRDVFDGRRGSDPLLFWVMAALPPLAHVALKGAQFGAAIQVYQAARRDAYLKID